MKFLRRYFYSLYFSKRFYWVLGIIIGLFVIAYAVPPLFIVAKLILLVYFLIVFIDYAVLFSKRNGVIARRELPDRLSNGDDNRVTVFLHNRYAFRLAVSVIDEVPVQFQERSFLLKAVLEKNERRNLNYTLRPVERGEYTFFDLNVYVTSPLQLVLRRFTEPARKMVKVYPSYFSLKKFDLIAHSNNLSETGNRKMRKIGQSIEFEQIREYVTGDDIRTLNWKATARKGGQLMVNSYTDERSQQIYCIIDKGRVMKMPFNGLTLLDYAINATLVLARVALLRQDRAGLITFADTIGNIVHADRKSGQMNNILETLYDQKTVFGESDFEKLYALVRTRVTQRSLVVLFTNFESLTGLQRQLPYLRAIARTHLVLTVFFENTELKRLTEQPADDIETLYIRTIAEKFAHEKRLMIKELQQHGIFTILTEPEQLTINAVNKYLELKARHAI